LQLIQSILEPLFKRYQEGMNALTRDSNLLGQVVIIEVKLAWLVYVIGTVVGGHIGSSASVPKDDHLEIDAQLSAMVFQIVFMIGRNRPATRYLDEAILYFFGKWKRAHVGYDGYSKGIGRVIDPKVEPLIYAKISEFVGQPTSQQDLLNMMLLKVMGVLELWSSNSDVVDQCLELLADMTSGYSTSKIMSNLDSADVMLRGHGIKNFPFMSRAENFKLRTKFYVVWGRLAFAERSIDFFDELMLPFEEVFANVMNKMQQQIPGTELEIKTLAVGLCRDLRGVASSSYNRSSYQIFFDWLYPQHFNILVSVFDRFWDDSFVCVAMLKFLAELCYNKAQRIDFPASSPNGIILFKEMSRVIQLYCGRMTSVVQNVHDISTDSRYKSCVKALSISMEILHRALLGNYVNFGVFILYKDDALSSAVMVVMNGVFAQSLANLMVYKKVWKNYFALLEALLNHHMDLVITFEKVQFSNMLGSLLDGLFDLDATICGIAAQCIDHLCTYRFAESKKKRKVATAVLLEHQLAEFSGVNSVSARNAAEFFANLLAALFNLVLFEGVSNVWAFSRPLLALIVTNESAYSEYRRQLIGIQPPPYQEKVAQAFEKLMDSVRPSLEIRNRDKFTQNLVFFVADLRKFVVKPSGLF